MIGGGLPVAGLARRLETSLSGQQGTLFGMAISAPWPIRWEVGDEYQEAGLKFVVRRIRRGKAFEVVTSRLPTAGP